MPLLHVSMTSELTQCLPVHLHLSECKPTNGVFIFGYFSPLLGTFYNSWHRPFQYKPCCRKASKAEKNQCLISSRGQTKLDSKTRKSSWRRSEGNHGCVCSIIGSGWKWAPKTLDARKWDMCSSPAKGTEMVTEIEKKRERESEIARKERKGSILAGIMLETLGCLYYWFTHLWPCDQVIAPWSALASSGYNYGLQIYWHLTSIPAFPWSTKLCHQTE